MAGISERTKARRLARAKHNEALRARGRPRPGEVQMVNTEWSYEQVVVMDRNRRIRAAKGVRGYL